MTKQIRVNGVIHRFPDDATDEDINIALNGAPSANQPSYQQQNMQNQMQHHPLLMKIAESLQGVPGLGSAGNVAGNFNKAFQGTGLPNLAKGFFEGSSDIVRGVGNLIPGINIPKQKGQEIPQTNPLLQNVAETAGNLIGSIPAFKGYQAINEATKLLPYAEKIPNSLKSILSGAAAGSAVAPDNRLLGGAIGATTASIPEITNTIKKLKPKNPFQAIQEGYEAKKSAISNLFEKTGKKIKQEGLDKIPIKQELLDEIIKIGPKTTKFKKFVSKAKNGDFDNLRKLQTELFHRSERYYSSPLGSEKDVGDEISEARKKINEAIAKHLQKNKKPELAKDINKAMQDWQNLNEIYHSHPTISKLVGTSKKIPSTNSVLKEKSTEINRLKQTHPEIEKSLKWDKNKKALASALSLYGAYEGTKELKNYLNK
jgi:hypothetical protein